MMQEEFKSQVTAIYNGKIKWHQNGFNHYAQLTGRKIQYHKESQNWTVKVFNRGYYVCQGSGTSCIEAEVDAARYYAHHHHAIRHRFNNEPCR
jgi:predicted secreted protein